MGPALKNVTHPVCIARSPQSIRHFRAPEKVTDSDCIVVILRDMTFLTLIICPTHFVFRVLVFCSLQRTCFEFVIQLSIGYFCSYQHISSLFFSFINTFCNGRSPSLPTTGALCKVSGSETSSNFYEIEDVNVQRVNSQPPDNAFLTF